uniref:glycoside hydrolase family 2 protein n=1 Tax=Barnesiella intestinihominis TaxID=487174 RepID=UPI003FEE58F4
MKRFITGSFLVLMSILSGFPVQAGKSLDEIDRESFAAKYILSELPGISMIPVSSVDTVRNREYFSLDGIWLMAEGGDEKLRLKDVWTDAVEAVVPGSVHTALLMNRIIPDPYIGQNDSIAEQQSYKTWWFSKKFTLNEPLENPILSFGGVANRCTVWLNGKKLGSHEGMFGGPDFAVKKYLKKENTLVVKLDPIPQMFLGNWPPNANESWKYTVVFNCVYGWHYAQIPSLGIWRSVKLESQAPVEIEVPFVSTRSLQGDMRLAVTLKKINAPLKGKLQIRVVPKNFEGAPQFFEHEINSSKKTEQFSFDFKIDAPRLWWPNDMGEQSLYDMTVAFIPRNGARPDVEKTSFGIRTIDMAPFPGGEREDRYNWTFVINGKPMFVKGTGWCTMDALMDFSREKYDRLLSIAKSQHIQMMRAWGGGLPETDDFYELCDKYGIMVIQEWPTAWNSHNTQPFDMLQETVVRNMKRIRNHPSLVMWGAGKESD